MRAEDLPEQLLELGAAAERVREHAYAPYSHFRVGAAVRGASGRIWSGCNVENASYGATLCAERAAIASMVSGGELGLSALAVFTDSESLTLPCGMCRQVMAEFGKDFQVALLSPRSARILRFAELFPEPFVLRP